ncbi:helix-turn-helix domain-containing protein [Paenibacillus eucommiae]|uniref:AraC-like DNA-binding protein n=1 Tax=Paenibacillus eucommiae TaxID=1355755 RepID=A0ABS4J1B0_9BACL|nr:AraC family transcriptional regulator [Paenibacillus eucommiae]MBP1993622.1 AraC-like DNA-binding protein [Paenibacillus eucommiae]
MRSHVMNIPFDAFKFDFVESPPQAPAQLDSIGCMEVNSTDHICNGLKRLEQVGSSIFQYTLKGKGMIRIGEQLYSLEAGKAFMVDVPSDHEYYYEGDADGWRVLFIVLNGEHVNDCWSFIRQQLGSVAVFEPDASVIRYLIRLYWEAYQGHLNDGFQSAGAAYQFITELYRTAHMIPPQPHAMPELVRRLITLMESDYKTLEGLDDLADRLDASKFHITRTFHQHTGSTVIQYLTKIRINRAIELLLNSNHNVEYIAQEVGYQNSKYFTKVFREQTKMPPGQYRNIYIRS